MKSIEEIVETINEYLEEEQIPEEWAFTETGELYRKDTNTGQVVAMKESDARGYYRNYVAEWCDDEETLKEEEAIEHIDFLKMKRDLHEQMYDAIVFLMEKHGKKELDISDEEGEPGYACFAWEHQGIAIEERQVETIKVERSHLFLRFVDGTHWYGAAISDDEILWCTINSVYDAVFQRLVKKGGEG